MRTSSLSLLRCAGLALVLPWLAGCTPLFESQPDTTRFFVLAAPGATEMPPPADAPRTATVGLGRIELPAYLRTPAVVLRPGGTEVRHAPAARWAEGLDQGIARVLRETLQAHAPVRAVVVYPAPQAALPTYEIFVRVTACEGTLAAGGGGVRFAAAWEIRATADPADKAPLASGRFESAPASWNDGDYAALTGRLGEAVAALGRELAAAVPR